MTYPDVTGRVTAVLVGSALTLAAVLSPTAPAGATVDSNSGVFWFLDGKYSITRPYEEESFQFGTAGDTPLSQVNSQYDGVWRPSDQRFRFDINNDLVTDYSVRYGAPGDIAVAHPHDELQPGEPVPFPLLGLPQIGVFRPSDGRWRLDRNLDGRTDEVVAYGTAGDVPLFGDTNGDHQVDLVMYRPTNNTFYIDTNRDGRSDRRVAFGTTGDVPFLASNGWFPPKSSIGTYRPSDRKVRVDENFDGRTDGTRVVHETEADITAGAQLLGVQMSNG